MQRYLVDVTNLRLDSEGQPQTSADGTPKARMYIAAPVEARISELERKKRVLWQHLHDLDEELTNQLPHWRGTKSHELLVEVLTECRTS